jgi:hypothetical protein
LTVSAWVGISPQSDLVIANNFDSGSQSFSGTATYSLEDNAALGVLTAKITTHTNTATLTVPTSSLPPVAANANAWHFLSATYDGSHLTLYVDGVSAGTTSASGTLVAPDTGDLFGIKNVGTNSATGYADTWVSQVSLATSALSTPNELALWTAGASADPGTAEVVYTDLGEGTEALSAVGATSVSASTGSVAALAFHVQCDLSGGGNYPIANASITWAGLTGIGSGTTTPQSFVNYDSANPWPPTTIPSSSGDLTASYVSTTDSTGDATAYPTTANAAGDWRVCTQQDAAGNCAVTYDVASTAPVFAGATWTDTGTASTLGPSSDTANPDPNPVACGPGTDTCVIAGSTTASQGGAEYSTDGGVTWTQSTSPVLSTFTGISAIACTSATVCLAAGMTGIYAQPYAQILRSTDSGATWAVTSIPALDPTVTLGSEFNTISCSDTLHCVAAGVTTSTPSSVIYPWHDYVLYTANGGTSWQASSVDTSGSACASNWAGCSVNTVSCAPSSSTCVGVGWGPSVSVGVLYSDDYGATWHSNPASAWSSIYPVGVSCPAANQCLATIWYGFSGHSAEFSSDGGQTWSWRSGPSGNDSITCPSTGLCLGSQMYSINGGTSWINPSGWPSLLYIGCSSANLCVGTADRSEIYVSP